MYLSKRKLRNALEEIVFIGIIILMTYTMLEVLSQYILEMGIIEFLKEIWSK